MAMEYFLNSAPSWLIVFGIILCFCPARLKKSILSRQRKCIPRKSKKSLGATTLPATDLFASKNALLFPGRTTHTRLVPKVHSFAYPFLLTAVPVRSCQSNWLFSVDSATIPWWKRGWFRVDAQDHLERDSEEDSLSHKLDAFLESKGHDPALYPTVWLITAPRFLGHKSNMASFWYLYSADRQLTAMVIEINNTFDERRLYLLPEVTFTTTTMKGERRKHHATWAKDIHVSCFNPRNGFYSISVTDLVLPAAENRAADKFIDINVTLLSEHRRPTFVSRLWSVSEPLDPLKLPVYRALIFLASWALQGPLLYSRIIFQTLTLIQRYRLKIRTRPEPQLGTIPRRSTMAERYIRSIFVAYLRNIMSTPPDQFRLELKDSAGPTGTSSTTLATPNAHPTSPTYVLTLLTPKFFSATIAHRSIGTLLSSALHPGIPTQTTAAITNDDADPMALVELVKSAAEQYDESVYETQTFSSSLPSVPMKYALWLLWACLKFVRDHITSGNNACEKYDSFDEGLGICFLDSFVRRNYSAGEQVRYLFAGLMIAIRERILGIVGGG